jgi:hypothetical protein
MRSMRRGVCTLFFLAAALMSAPAVFGGEVIYQKAFGGGVKKPVTLTETFTLTPGKEPYILNVVNGGADGKNRLSSVTVSFNGQQIVGASELSQSTEAVNRGITPAGESQLTLTLRGATNGFVLVRILGGVASATTPPPPATKHNETQSNADSSLSGLNMGDAVALWFDRQPTAALYVVSAASSPDGPWQEIQHLDATLFPEGRNPTTVDTGDDADTGQAREANNDFRDATTYYRMLAFDSAGGVVKDYGPVSVPPYVEEAPAPVKSLKAVNPTPRVAGKSPITLLEKADCGGPCVYDQPFLSDSTFTDDSTMSLDDIRQLLKDHNSFLQGDQNHQIKDVDGNLIDPAQLIYDAAQNNDINPQVILATLQKESSAITLSTLPSDTRLRNLTGFGNGSTVSQQITSTGAQLHLDFTRLAAGGETRGGWKPNSPHRTDDGKTVCPANNSSAILFNYTPYVGAGWGGSAGGNALFFDIFYGTLGFGQKPQLCGIYSFSSMAPTGDVLTRRPTLSVQVSTGGSCGSNYTLFLDGKNVATATNITGSTTLRFTVTSDLAFGRHTARIVAESPDCGMKSSRTWRFQVKRGKKIAMVIDDTGSMGDEIDAVKGALASFITSQTSQPNSPDIEWTLVTFKDDVSVRGTTTDAGTIQAQVASLFASGGDDCPEEGLGALNTGASVISGDDEASKSIIFVTDASPHGGAGDVSATIAAMQASGIPVNTLLTGDCVDTAAVATAATAKVIAKDLVILSAREVFSQISEQTGGLYFFLPGASVEDLTAALNDIFQSAGGGGGTDTAPPRLSLEVSPAVLTPVSHELVEIAPILKVSDDADPHPRVTLLSVTTSEPEDGQGSGNTPGDIVITEDGRIFLRAERSGTGNSRTYTITYRATDASGKSTTASADVLVPHDNK